MKRRWFIASRPGRAAVAATAMFMIALLSSGPVLADTDIGTSGVVGVHSLVDTHSKAGVTCRYNAAVLKYVDVRPPRMRAASGRQKVAWRFAVVRTRIPYPGPTTVKTTYTSPWQSVWATTTKNARFSTKTINVTIPRDGRAGGVEYSYVVNVEMVWYQSNGRITGRSTHRVDNYRWVVGTWAQTDHTPCDGWVAA